MKKDNRNAIIIGLLIAIAFMSVGYALITTKVDNDNLTTSLTGKKYHNVKISTISSVETVGNAVDVKSYISGEREVTLYPEILESGDSITYTINVVNNGNNPATLNSMDIKKNSDYIVYTIGNLNAGDVINPGESKMFTITLSYNEEYTTDALDIAKEVVVGLNFN